LRTRKGVRKINNELPTREELKAMSDEEFEKAYERILGLCDSDTLSVGEIIDFYLSEIHRAAEENED